MLKYIDPVLEDDNLSFRTLPEVMKLFDSMGEYEKELTPAKNVLNELSYLINDVYTDVIKPINSYDEYSHIITDFDFMTLPRVYAVLKSLANEPGLWTEAIGKFGVFSLTNLCSIIIKDVSSLRSDVYISSQDELEELYPGIVKFLDHNTSYLDYVILAHNVKMYRNYIIGLSSYHGIGVEELSDSIDSEMDSLFEDVLSKYVLTPIELEYTEVIYNNEDHLARVRELMEIGLLQVLPNGTIKVMLDGGELADRLELENFDYDIELWLSTLIRVSGTVPLEEDSELLDGVEFENRLLEDRDIEVNINELNQNHEAISTSMDVSDLLRPLGVSLDFLLENKHILNTMEGRKEVFNMNDEELNLILFSIEANSKDTNYTTAIGLIITYIRSTLA